MKKTGKGQKIKHSLAWMLIAAMVFGASAERGTASLYAQEVKQEQESGASQENGAPPENGTPESGGTPGESGTPENGTPENGTPENGASGENGTPENGASGENAAPENGGTPGANGTPENGASGENAAPENGGTPEEEDALEKPAAAPLQNTAAAAAGEIVVDATNFTDPLLLAFASAKDTSGDGKLQPDELSAITEFLYPAGGIGSLKGLEYFTGLTKVDVSGNGITDLAPLQGLAELTVLKVGGNPATALDVSKNTKLERLLAANGALQSLTLGGNTALAEIYVGGNSLTALETGGLPGLKILSCENNQLAELRLSGNSMLETVQAGNNRLTVLEVSGLASLVNLECQNNQLTEINLSGLTALAGLNVSGNRLGGLSLSGLSGLSAVFAGGNALTGSLETGTASLVSLEGNQIQNLMGLGAVAYLNCRNNQLTGLSVPSAQIAELYCSENALTVLEIGHTDVLESLYCGNNKLTSLEVGENALDLRLSPQTTSLKRYRDGERNWSELGDLLAAGWLPRAEVATGGDVLSYDRASGVVTYANAASSLTYQYLAGEAQGARMTVTAALTEEDRTETEMPPAGTPGEAGNTGDAGNTNTSALPSATNGVPSAGGQGQRPRRSAKAAEKDKNKDGDYSTPRIEWHDDGGEQEIVDADGKKYLIKSEKISETAAADMLAENDELKSLLEERDNHSWMEIHLEDIRSGKKVQPSGKVEFFLDYPEGADATYVFTVIHLEGGTTPVVLQEGTDYFLKEEGLLLTVDSFSPFIIAWDDTDEVVAEAAEPVETPEDDAGETANGQEDALVAGEPKKSSPAIGIAVLLVLAGVAVGIFFWVSKKKKDDEDKL